MSATQVIYYVVSVVGAFLAGYAYAMWGLAHGLAERMREIIEKSQAEK